MYNRSNFVQVNIVFTSEHYYDLLGLKSLYIKRNHNVIICQCLFRRTIEYSQFFSIHYGDIKFTIQMHLARVCLALWGYISENEIMSHRGQTRCHFVFVSETDLMGPCGGTKSNQNQWTRGCCQTLSSTERVMD